MQRKLPITPRDTSPTHPDPLFAQELNSLLETLENNTLAIGIMSQPKLLIVPCWVVEQLYDPATPGKVQMQGSEEAREYLRSNYGVTGELDIYWWGRLSTALENAGRYLDQIMPADGRLADATEVTAS